MLNPAFLVLIGLLPGCSLLVGDYQTEDAGPTETTEGNTPDDGASETGEVESSDSSSSARIVYFRVNNPSPIFGDGVTFSWQTVNTEICTLDDQEVATAGTKEIQQPCPRNYELRCQGNQQTVSQAITIEVICSTTNTISSGQKVESLEELRALKALSMLGMCMKIQYGIEIRFSADITDLSALYGLTVVQDNLDLYDNLKLENLDGLCMLEQVGSLRIGRYYDAASNDDPPGGHDPAHYGNPVLKNIAGLSGLKTIDHMLVIEKNDALSDLHGLENLSFVGGKFLIQYSDNLSSIEALSNLASVGGDDDLNDLEEDYLAVIDAPNLTSLEGLQGLRTINGFFAIENTGIANLAPLNITPAERFSSVAIVGNSQLKDLSGLAWLTRLTRPLTTDCPDSEDGCLGSLYIENNDQLLRLDGLENLDQIDQDLVIADNDNLTDISALSNLTSVGCDIEIAGNMKLSTLIPLGAITDYGWGHQVTKGISIANNPALESLWDVSPNSVVALTCVEIFSNGALSDEKPTQFITSLRNADPTITSGTADLPSCP